MLNISDRFLAANVSNSREPALVIEVQNENGNIYFTTSKRIKIVDAGSHRFDECIVSATGGSQKITPERGQSTIGDYTFTVIDQGLTDFQRILLSSFNDTLNNNKVIFHYGLMNIRFEDYVSLPPQYINEVNQDVNQYTFKTSDTQRFIRQKVFGSKSKTTLVKGIGFADATPTSTKEIEVLDNAAFNAVFHDSNWVDAPGREVGYLVASGTDSNGDDALEVIRWSGKTGSNKFVVDGRALFGTRQIDLAGSQDGGSIELEEFIYLDLNIPKMILAIMNGSLYGDAGKRLPDNWNAGVSSVFINTPSFEEIGGDLWDFNLQFIGLKEDSAKEFIYEQCLKPFNLFMYIDQDGQLYLKRFSDIPYDAPAEITINNESILSSPEILRNSKAIRNVFRVNWSWDWKEEKYARENGYIDADSFARNNIWSETLDINIKGIRNRDTDSQAIISSLAEGIRARYSEPQIKPTVSVLMSSAIMLEVGSIIKLDLANQPDFISDRNLNMSFEVQGISWNFLEGTMDLDLFGSSGKATPIDFDLGSNSIDVDYGAMGWTAIESVVSGTPDENTFVIDQNQTIGSRDSITLLHNSFGDIKIADGITLTTLGTVWFGCKDFTIVNTGKINAKSGGVIGGKGYFGGEDSSQEGMKTSIKWKGFGPFKIPDRYVVRQNPGEGRGLIGASNSVIEKFYPSLNSDGSISKLPTTTKLFGNGGGAGGGLRNSAGLNQGLYAGGDAVSGGGGIAFCVNNLFFDNAECIDVSGSDNDPSVAVIGVAGTDYAAGAGGFGWPGAVLCFITDITSPRPNLSGAGGAVKARVGNWSEISGVNKRPKENGDRSYKTVSGDNFAPLLPSGRVEAGKDYSAKCSGSFYVKKDPAFSPVAGKDIIENTGSPVININQKINFPDSPKGDKITLELTATAVDNKFGFAFFDYRIKGQTAWYPAKYGLTNESTVEVTALGDTYEIRARAYNTQGTAGGISAVEHTVPLITKNPDESAGGNDVPPIEIQVPTVKGLELVNRIDNNENWNQWKSPNAEFKWKRSAILNAGSIVSMNGVEDLHLKGYNVRIRRSKAGEILREEEIKENIYTYTFDKNKKDTGGSPVRQFYIEVQAVASTGHSSTWSGFDVANPAPAAVTGISTEIGYNSFNVKFDLPTDVDFVGVDFYLVQGTGNPFTSTPLRVQGNTVSIENLAQGTEYRFGLTSVDQFGVGSSSSSVAVTTKQLAAIDVDGLGPWATVDGASSAFIQSQFEGGSISEALIAAAAVSRSKIADDAINAEKLEASAVTNEKLAALAVDAAKLANSSVTSTKIANLAVGTAAIQDLAVTDAKINTITAAKITAGTVTVQVDIGTGIILDGASGVIKSSNAGYEITMGAVSVPSESSNPLILNAYDGSDYAFWVDSSGAFSFGFSDANITFNSSQGMRIGRGTVFAGNDSYGNDYLYRNVVGYDAFKSESASYGVTVTGINNNKATSVSLAGAGAGSKFSRVELAPESQFSYGFLNFDTECRLKVRFLPGGSANNDDVFIIGMGNGLNNSQGAILIQFRGTGSAFSYGVRSSVTKPSDSYASMPPESVAVGAYSSEVTKALTSPTDLEIVYIPNTSLRVYINGVDVPELGYGDGNIYNSVFYTHLPARNPLYDGYQLPYFNLAILDSGTDADGAMYWIGDVKLMNAPV